MVFSFTNAPKLSAADMGVPDYADALQKGFETSYKPRNMAAALLDQQLKNKYSAFKAAPDYQSAMLDYLRGQGAHMWGQTQNLPAEGDLRRAQANEITSKGRMEDQKLGVLRDWMSGIKTPRKDASYEAPAQSNAMGDIYGGNTQPASFGGEFTNVGQGSSLDKSSEFDAGNQEYQREKTMAGILGFKEPATFVDPKTGIAYARLRSGTVPIGKEFGESEKASAGEVGKSKGIEESAFTSQSPGDRRLLQKLTEGIKKVNKGEWDATLGWKHNIPYGLNTKLSDKQIGEVAAFEKILNTLKIKQHAAMMKGQGAVSDFERGLLNSTLPDFNANPAAFKGQLNDFLQGLQQRTFESQQIRNYEKQGMSFDDARDKAQKDSDEMFSGGEQQANQPEPENKGIVHNAMYEPAQSELEQMANDFQNQSIAKPVANSGFMQKAQELAQEAKKYAPIAGDVAASGLLATPNPYAKGLGGALAAGLGAYQAEPGKRIQGAIQNVGMDMLPGYAGKLLKSITGKSVAKNTVKATEKLFQSRVKPFEEVISEANKLGKMKTPQNMANVKTQLSEALSGHSQNFTKQLHQLTKFGNKPIFENAQKAQSALGQIERADVAEPIRAAARDMRKRILGGMQTHLAESSKPELLPKYAATMREYAKSGPLLKDLAAKAKDMSAKDFTSYVKSLSKKGGLSEDVSSLSKGIQGRQAKIDFAKTIATHAASGIPIAGSIGIGKLMGLIKGI